jgi:hypothetical protein
LHICAVKVTVHALYVIEDIDLVIAGLTRNLTAALFQDCGSEAAMTK